ncbi:MAG: DUF2946 family protein [Sheuella sp.]|nr:DUF2946 family protein [Sheuella sp.]
MDQSVLDALRRWPDVPAVYGWLSLTARGDWRLHPLGDAQHGGAGEGITNPQILGFMGRNYSSEPDGKWFFQNGPQRVYVRLDAAPYIAHLQPETASLITHNGLIIEQVLAWFSDDTGQLYTQTNLGAARIDDRDLIALADILQTQEKLSLLDTLEAEDCAPDTTDTTARNPDSPAFQLSDPTGHYQALRLAVPCNKVLHSEIAHKMGFMMNPQSATTSPTSILK